MTLTVNSESLAKIPIVARLPDGGRQVLLLPFFDLTNRKWHMFVPNEKGNVEDGLVVDLATGTYLASAPADPTRDFRLAVETLVFQHLSFPNVTRSLAPLTSDFHRCAAVLEKYNIIWGLRERGPLAAPLLVIAELEYLLMLLRSLFDTFQRVIQAIGKHLVPLGASRRRALPQLPDSFADVALKGNSSRPRDELIQRYGLPPQFAGWYAEEAPFFAAIRAIRDAVAHRGHELPFVFVLPQGFALEGADKPWVDLKLSDTPLLDNKFRSLRSVFAGLILHSLRATERFAGVVKSVVELPTAVHPDLAAYMRSPFGEHLMMLDKTVQQPWEGIHPSIT